MLNFGLLKGGFKTIPVGNKDKESSNTNSDTAVKEKGKKDVKTRNG